MPESKSWNELLEQLQGLLSEYDGVWEQRKTEFLSAASGLEDDFQPNRSDIDSHHRIIALSKRIAKAKVELADYILARVADNLTTSIDPKFYNFIKDVAKYPEPAHYSWTGLTEYAKGLVSKCDPDTVYKSSDGTVLTRDQYIVYYILNSLGDGNER